MGKHYGESIGAITFDFNDLEKSMSRSLRFRRLTSRKELGYVLLLNTNAKSHMGNPTAPSHLTLSNLESQSHGHSDFESLYVVNEPRYSICY